MKVQFYVSLMNYYMNAINYTSYAISSEASTTNLNRGATGGGEGAVAPPLDGQGGATPPPLILAISYTGRSPTNPRIKFCRLVQC